VAQPRRRREERPLRGRGRRYASPGRRRGVPSLRAIL